MESASPSEEILAGPRGALARPGEGGAIGVPIDGSPNRLHRRIAEFQKPFSIGQAAQRRLNGGQGSNWRRPCSSTSTSSTTASLGTAHSGCVLRSNTKDFTLPHQPWLDSSKAAPRNRGKITQAGMRTAKMRVDPRSPIPDPRSPIPDPRSPCAGRRHEVPKATGSPLRGHRSAIPPAARSG
jgi:hypothetical protein